MRAHLQRRVPSGFHRDRLADPVLTTSSLRSAGSAAGLRRKTRSESGQSIVEFALVVPLILVLVLVLVDFGKAMNYWLDLTRVANEGARLAVVSPSLPTESSIRARLLSNELRNGGTASVVDQADVDISGGCAVGDPVTVVLTSEYHWFDVPSWIPITGGGLVTIRGRATMRREQACP